MPVIKMVIHAKRRVPLVEPLPGRAGYVPQRNHGSASAYRHGLGKSVGGPSGDISEKSLHGRTAAGQVREQSAAFFRGRAVDRCSRSQPAIGPAQQRTKYERLVLNNWGG